MEASKISSPQGTPSTHGARSRSQANSQEAAAADAGGGGFLALLAALGATNPAVDPGAETAAAADAALPGASDGQEAAVLAAWQGLLAPDTDVRVDTNVPGAQQTGFPGAANLGGSGASGLGAVAAGLPGGGALGAEMALGANGAVQGIVAETAMLDASGGSRNGLPVAAGAATGRAFSRLQNAMAQRAEVAEASAGRLQPSAATQTLGGQAGAVHGMLLTNLAERLPGGATMGGVERAGGGSVDSAGAGSVATSLMEAVASAALAGGGTSADARSRSGEGRSEGAAVFDPVAGSAPAEVGSVDGAAVFADPAQANLEDQVAEQVAYWVNQKTQNAELTLDRDGQPVEVSVTLSGNEAHVAFRSDQSATREMLDKSMAQLSELLRSEGLVLSGMSVGTSSGQREQTGDSGRQGQREGGRQARVEAAAPLGTGALMRAGAPDRAVDVFV